MAFCRKCGNEIKDGVKFCPMCGQAVDGAPQQPVYQQQPQGCQPSLHVQKQQRNYQQGPRKSYNHRLTFVEAVNLAAHRLTELRGRSRRSEYWWWYLAVIIVGIIIGFIPYVESFSFLVQYALLFSVTYRRLNDVAAPKWVWGMYLSPCLIGTVMSTMFYLGSDYDVLLLSDLVKNNAFLKCALVFILSWLFSQIILICYCVKDSNPRIDPVHGASPKYTFIE